MMKFKPGAGKIFKPANAHHKFNKNLAAIKLAHKNTFYRDSSLAYYNKEDNVGSYSPIRDFSDTGFKQSARAQIMSQGFL